MTLDPQQFYEYYRMVEEENDPLDWVQKNISIETEVYKDKGKEYTKEVINFVFPK